MPDKTNDFKTRLTRVHRAISRWYQAHGRRHLPWRNTRDPYAVYVSEIMLQQTQVRTVLERYYTPFLRRFPTLASLAKAKEQEVMKLWEGLGYYTRATNLHKAAQQCGGILPQTVEGLIQLPGIGRNTAHAIACFAFGASESVMEANVRRVLCRVFALRKADDKVLWQKARQVLDTENAFDYNQAMMDIGALVCTKRNPQCGECPLSLICKGKTNPASYPAAKRAKVIPVRTRVIVAARDDKGQFYIARRKTRFLKGLYGFMEYEAETKSVLFAGAHYPLLAKDRLGVVTQSYSHFTLNAMVYLLPVSRHNVPGLQATTLEKIKRLPLSRADQKIVEMIDGCIAG